MNDPDRSVLGVRGVLIGGRCRPTLALVLGLGIVACASAGGDPDDDSELSRFEEGSPVTGRVVENSTACEVDASCYLRIEFADTTVAALYGTGERPAPPCTMSVEVSDVAFGVGPGDLVEVVISPCGSEGRYIERIVADRG